MWDSEMLLTCRKCGRTDHCSAFTRNRKISRGYNLCCKDCRNLKQRVSRQENKSTHTKKYEKTLSGFIMRAYRNMLSRVSGVQKRKSHLYEGLEILSKEDFKAWSVTNNDLLELHAKWVESGFDRKITPSVDRIDSEKGYNIDNIRWLTHSENSKLGATSLRRGLRNAS